MTNSELRLLESFAKHIGRIFDRYPQPPPDCDTVTHNAYRIAKRTELKKIQAKIEKWKQEQNT